MVTQRISVPRKGLQRHAVTPDPPRSPHSPPTGRNNSTDSPASFTEGMSTPISLGTRRANEIRADIRDRSSPELRTFIRQSLGLDNTPSSTTGTGTTASPELNSSSASGAVSAEQPVTFFAGVGLDDGAAGGIDSRGSKDGGHEHQSNAHIDPPKIKSIPETNLFCSIESREDLNPEALVFSSITAPDTITRVCKKLVPGWSSIPIERLGVAQIMSGLTNQLFKVYVMRPALTEPRSDPLIEEVLFRVYGANHDCFYDPEFERTIFIMLGDYNIAPKLLAEFPGGRIEEFIRARPATFETQHLPSFLCAMAAVLARFHSFYRQEPDFGRALCRHSSTAQYLTEWMAIAESHVKAGLVDAEIISDDRFYLMRDEAIEVPKYLSLGPGLGDDAPSSDERNEIVYAEAIRYIDECDRRERRLWEKLGLLHSDRTLNDLSTPKTQNTEIIGKVPVAQY
eukprot:Selendium_serpulae@DN5419_c0_g1_i1.p1